MVLVGITGTLGAGKGTVVEYLVKNWKFKHYSVREFITEEIVRRGLEVNRDTMTLVGNELRKEHGSGYITKTLGRKAFESRENSIIESIRTIGEIIALEKEFGNNFLLIAVDANQHSRYERISSRKSETDNVTFAKFCSDEEREMTSTDPNKQNLSVCIEEAHFLLQNDSTLESLHMRIDSVIIKILNNQQT